MGAGNPFIGGGGIFSLVLLLLVCWFIYGCSIDKDCQKAGTRPERVSFDRIMKLKGWYITWVVFCLMGIVGNSLLPTKDTAYKMLAAYGVTELVKSEDVRRLGSKSLEVLERAMDSYIGESPPDT